VLLCIYDEKTEKENIMITSEDKVYVMDLVKKLTPDILEKLNFDSTVKEVGHSFCDRYEDELVKMLLDIDDDFTEPTKDRSLDDIKYKGNYINIKFGYKKNGQPNLCAGNKLFDYLAGVGGKSKDIEIDSYYVISVDAYGPTYMFYDVYEYLQHDCFHYNAGPGQFMIKESVIKKVYEFNKKNSPIDKETIFNIINKIMAESADKTWALRKNSQQKREDIINEYKQGNLSQFCAA